MTPLMPKPENLAKLVYLIRNEKVMFDTDLASLYGVEARALNQAVARNRDRFPEDFMFQLTAEEWAALRSQTVTSSGGAEGNSSQTVMSSGKHRGLAYRPYAFTEQGVAMLSSVLRSQRAVEVNIAIMRTFVQLCRLMDSNRDLARRIDAPPARYSHQRAALLSKDHRHLRHQRGLRRRPPAEAAVFCHGAKQGALRHSRPDGGGVDCGAGRQQPAAHGLDQLAKTHAEQEFEKFRRLEDASLESDFDRMVKSLPFKKPGA